jgi:hypothetical protein
MAHDCFGDGGRVGRAGTGPALGHERTRRLRGGRRDRNGDEALTRIEPNRRRGARSGLPARCAWAPALARLPLSGSSRAAAAGETAAQSRMEQSVNVGGALLQLVQGDGRR